jgi:hypothetical protein
VKATLAATAVLALAAALRLSALDIGWLGVDQGRDLAWAEHIAAGDRLPTVGPLMRNRFHLGATYYYFWSLPALVATGPYTAYAFAALLGVAAVAGAGGLAHGIAGPAAGLAAMAWLATQPRAVIDSRVAWAPAALPAVCALLLLVAIAHLRSPGRAKASAVAAIAGLATQLHLAAVALAPVAAAAVLARLRVIGMRGLAIAVVCGAIPLVPMLAAWPVAVPEAGPAAVVVSPMEGRIADLGAIDARWLDGLSPTAPARPRAVDAWLGLETIAGWLPLLAALVAIGVSPSVRQPGGLRLVVAAFVACVAVPMLLPAEVWGYYLDASLVPGAVVVGVAATRPRWRIAGIALVIVLCVGRAAVVGWWISTAATQGFVSANLDFLRVGGPRPVEPAARARLLGFGVKQRGAEVLVDELGISPSSLSRRVHGPGFSDLDTDNGYVLRRARGAGEGKAGSRPRGTPGADTLASRERTGDGVAPAATHALVLYRDEIEPSWVAGFGPPRDVGPLEIYEFVPILRTADAVLSGCGGLPAPTRPLADPLEYGSGRPSLPEWPCARPIVVVPFGAPPGGVTVRVFPRVIGSGRVLAVEADSPTTSEVAPAPGLGDGVRIGPRPGELHIRLAIDGPAALDIVELHGRDSVPPQSRAPGAADAGPARLG